MRRSASVICLIGLAALAACTPDAERTDSLDPEHVLQDRESLPPEVTAHLDSGTVAFRDDDFDAALLHYERAVEMAPDFGAAWFGVYMVESARGNVEAAEAALSRAQETMPGATLLSSAGDTTR